MPELTRDDLLRATAGDVGRFVVRIGGKEELIPEVQDLWGQVPFDISTLPKLSVRQKALLAIVFFQAKSLLEKLSGRTRTDGIFAGVEWSKKQQDAFLSTARQFSAGKGGKGILTCYPWLDLRHKIPALRESLGMSDEGLRKAVNRLRIRLIKSNTAKIGSDSITRSSALLLLNTRLARKPGNEGKTAQQIWDFYASSKRNAPGFSKLKAILKSHGANCSPLATHKDTFPNLFSSQL